MPAYADSRALAVCTALDVAGVSAEQVGMYLDAYEGLLGLSADTDEESLSATLYRAVYGLAHTPAEHVGWVAFAADNPAMVDKNPLSVWRYRSLSARAKRLQGKMDGPFGPDLDQAQWMATAAEVQHLASVIAAKGQDKMQEWVQFAVRVRQDGLSALSYEDVIDLVRDVLHLAAEVDFTRVYVLEARFPNLCDRDGARINAIVRALADVPFEDWLHIAAQMPNRTRTMLAAVRYLFHDVGISLDDACTLIAHAQGYGLLPPECDVETVRTQCAYLAAAPAEPTVDEWEQITPHAALLWQQLAVWMPAE